MMQTYPLHAVGLLLTEEIAAHVLRKAAGTDGGALPVESSEPADAAEYLEDTCPGLIQHMEFTGVCTTVDWPGGQVPQRAFVYSADYIAYVPIEKTPTVFDPAYASPDELVEELTSKFPGIFPGDFDIRPFVCVINGACTA